MRNATKMRPISDRIAKRMSLFSLLFLLAFGMFAAGFTIANHGIWPFAQINLSAAIMKSLLYYGEYIPEGRRVTAPPDASRAWFDIHAPKLQNPGYYAFMGWDDEIRTYAVWLYGDDGQRLHRWRIDYQRLDPDGPSNGSDAPHALEVLADGSILVGFDRGDVLAKLDACSRPVWIRRGIFHHSLEAAHDGSVWTWRGEGTAYGHFNYMENFDPDTGRTIRAIGLVEDVVANSGENFPVFTVRPTYPFMHFAQDPADEHDIFHPNDVEELSPDDAAAFPMFEAGDLMLSFRSLSLVVVIDSEDFQVKWWRRGPWRFQHDPDFTSDGTISVFSNYTERGKSEIVQIDPTNREIEPAFWSHDFFFFTAFEGKHQVLPNGNLLLIIPGEGRAVELTFAGQKVLEFNNMASPASKYDDHLVNGTFVPPDFFGQMPSCS